MENIPKDIEKYLVRDEIVEKHFHLRKLFSLSVKDVYATDRRLFIKEGAKVTDIDYGHISSIELKQERYWPAIVIGILLAALGFAVLWDSSAERIIFINDLAAQISVVVGFILVTLGLVRSQCIELTVVGFSVPYPLWGHRSMLDSLFKLIREKRI